MSLRRSLAVLAACALVIALHAALVPFAARHHVAHALLGAGNGMPPVTAAVLATLLVVLRFAAIVVAPGAILASLVGLAAHLLEGRAHLPVEGGTGSSSGAGSSVAEGAGTSIGARGTK